MEKPELKTPSRREIIEAFGDRVLWKPEDIVPQYLELDENLMEKDLVGADFARKAREATLTDSNTFDQFANWPKERFERFESYKRASEPISSVLLRSGNDPITLTTVKYMENCKPKGMNQIDQAFLNFRILKGDFTDLKADEISKAWFDKARNISEFGFSKDSDKDDTFNLQHRLVQPQYRGPRNNLSNIMLKAAEQIVQSYADEDGKEKTMEIGATQLDVMIWAYNNGYEPNTDQDREKLERVMNADKDLIIVERYFVWETNKWQEGVEPNLQKNESLKIVFVKKFKPNPNIIFTNLRQKTKEILE